MISCTYITGNAKLLIERSRLYNIAREHRNVLRYVYVTVMR